MTQVRSDPFGQIAGIAILASTPSVSRAPCGRKYHAIGFVRHKSLPKLYSSPASFSSRDAHSGFRTNAPPRRARKAPPRSAPALGLRVSPRTRKRLGGKAHVTSPNRATPVRAREAPPEASSGTVSQARSVRQHYSAVLGAPCLRNENHAGLSPARARHVTVKPLSGSGAIRGGP